MTNNTLRKKQEEFEIIWKDVKEGIEEAEKDRIEFLKKFPVEQIPELSLEKYAIGLTNKGNPDTFCYLIERKLDKLGSFRGYPSTKFGIYYGKNNRYEFVDRFGSNEIEAFKNVKLEIVNLINAGKNKDIEALKENKLYSNFKGKILATYYPNTYLNIFSNEHLKTYCIDLNINFVSKDNEINLRQKLLDFKNNDEIMKNWDNNKFSSFLYNKYTPTGRKTEEYKECFNLPDINSQYPVFVELNEITKRETTADKKKNNRKTDFEKLNKIRKFIGNHGEKLVEKAEINRLTSINRIDLAKKVKIVSDDYSLGFDILSFDETGKEKHIEVKTISDKLLFYLTQNEHEKAEQSDNYYIYLVLDFKSKKPRINEFHYQSQKQQLKFTPKDYIVEVI